MSLDLSLYGRSRARLVPLLIDMRWSGAGNQSFGSGQVIDTVAEGAFRDSMTQTINTSAVAGVVSGAYLIGDGTTRTGQNASPLQRTSYPHVKTGTAMRARLLAAANRLTYYMMGDGAAGTTRLPYAYVQSRGSCVIRTGEDVTSQEPQFGVDTDCEILLVRGGFDSAGDPANSGNIAASNRGAAMFRRAFVDAQWVRIWSSPLPSAAPTNCSPGIAGVTNNNNTHATSEFSLSNPDARGNYSAALLPTFRELAPAAASTQTGDAEAHLKFKIGTLPTLGQIEVVFRAQDANNYWRVTVDMLGNVDLDEVVAGVATQRGTGTGAAAGQWITVVTRGNSIDVFRVATRLFTYVGTGNFATQTTHRIDSLGTSGGSITSWACWPRVLTINPV